MSTACTAPVTHSDCLVIGAGASGLLVARRLARAGLKVIVLERGASGREASWAGGGIPLQNYVAWFVLAAALAAFHPRQLQRACDLGTTGRLAGLYVVLQAAFFGALRLVWHFQGS